jgi:hypothetical protein
MMCGDLHGMVRQRYSPASIAMIMVMMMAMMLMLMLMQTIMFHN